MTSFYFFPFEFTFLPGVNTKKAMAGVGLILLIIQLARQKDSIINRDIFQLSIGAGSVSLIGFFAVTWNDTYDYTYATYLVSMWVWLSGAYVVIQTIKKLHGSVNVELVCNYLIVVSVTQCLIAFAMTQFPPLKNFVDSFLGSTGFMGKMENRMYGIGASLDVAGSRFSVILVMIVYLLSKITPDKKKYIGLYWIIFFVIAVIGNMMSRTTIVGVIIALVYLLYVSRIYTFQMNLNMQYVWGWFVGILGVSIMLMVYGYHANLAFQENLRFGFEGFFSLVEKGRWEVHSNDILKDMYVFPDNLKTWMIGDGYFNGPEDVDPYYIGEKWDVGYYKGTDVGYLRFIFYFGVTGLIAFSSFIYKTAVVCMRRFKDYRNLFLMVLFLNFIIWFKVSTDLFLVFALFLCLLEENKDSDMKECLENVGQ